MTSIARDSARSSSARAWHLLDGTGTISTLSSFNVSSATDNGTGNYVTSLSNDMSDANYIISGTVIGNSSGNYYSHITSDGATSDVVAGSYEYHIKHHSGSTNDINRIRTVVHGDLA
tara:strand:+ start:1098 stop:1448 length:351 start_codon:yes stop_codon:yes gene_type:complete